MNSSHLFSKIKYNTYCELWQICEIFHQNNFRTMSITFASFGIQKYPWICTAIFEACYLSLDEREAIEVLNSLCLLKLKESNKCTFSKQPNTHTLKLNWVIHSYSFTLNFKLINKKITWILDMFKSFLLDC